MFKFSNILIVFLLILSGFLFFAGGYIFNYMQSGSGVLPSVQRDTVISTDWRKPQIIGQSSMTEVTPQVSSYRERSQILTESKQASDSLLEKGKERSKEAAKREVKRLSNKAVRSVEMKVRETFGRTFASIFDPFVRTVAQGTVGSALNRTFPSQDPSKEVAGSSADLSPEGGVAASEYQDEQANRQLSQSQKGLFALKIQSYLDSADAFRMERKLKKQGYDAAYVVRERKDEKILFTVRIGNFATFQDAVSLRKVLPIPSYVVVASLQDDFVRF